jgi:hypothetical protein
MIKLKQLLTEKTVRLSTMKDANFVPGQFVQLMGKKGMVKLDKKSVHKLAKIVRQLSGKKGMGWSFTSEGKLNEGKVVTLPNGVKVKIDFKGLTFMGGTKPVFLDRSEMMVFFKATARYLK